MGDGMSDYEKLKKIMKKRLKKSRYQHTLGVVESAKALARIHNVNEANAEISALLHDYGKNLDKETLLRLVLKYDIHMDEVTRDSVSLLHGEVGAELVCEELGICDEDVLNAIRYHTYGRVGMSKLEKVVYIADAIEPGRNYPGVDELRDLANKDLDQALKRALSDSIKFVVEKGHSLHLNTIALWNDLIINS